MKRFLNLATRTKLFFGFGLMIIVLGIVVVTAYKVISAIQESERAIYEEDFATAVDLKTLGLSGEPVLLADAVGGTTAGRPGFSSSNNGVLVYARGSAATAGRELFWVDRSGKRSGPVGPPVNATTLKLSPDGKRIAFSDTSTGTPGTDIWIHEFDRNLRTRLTTNAATDDNPIWSPDGSQLIFNSTRDGVSGLYEKPSNGANAERLVYKSEPGADLSALDWSRDSRLVLFAKSARGQIFRDLWVMPMTGDQKPYPYLVTPFDKSQASLSPNGRWAAYVSRESGMYQVVVQPFPDPSAGKWQISTDGGIRPRWRADGEELYYEDRSNRIVSVSVTTNQKFEVGKSTPLLQTSLTFPNPPITFPYDAAPDGLRFVISELSGVGPNNTSPLTVVLNWAYLLKQ